MLTESDLRKIHLFKGLSSGELNNLLPLLRERKSPKGSYILYEDDPGPCLLFLIEGKVKVTLVSDDGKEIVLAVLSEGDFFGEMSVLSGEERSANVVATEDCLTLVLSKEDFEQHLLTNSGLALAMLKEIASRLRAASSKIGDLALFDVYRRVARTLRSLGEKIPGEPEEKLIIKQRPTHQELSAMVGTSREMVTRALKGLEEDGCIETTGKTIVIHRMPL